MNYIEEMKNLRKDFECQCIENGRKQDRIKELKDQVEDLTKQLEQQIKDNEKILVKYTQLKHNYNELLEALNDRRKCTKRK